ncbi:MAG: hypothetical protein HOB05_05485 [Bacteroidetes bacterium]|jgi:hypothetical protein|nr:hypothetical protein [Bacteroidota bacterium]MBT7143939.1 hypothetical protein [Bacteroidota bacterium]
MKKIILILVFLSISFGIFSQDVVLLKNGNVMTGKLVSNSKNNYVQHFIISDSVSNLLDYDKITCFIKDYENVSRAQYFRKATSYYNASTLIGLLGMGVTFTGVLTDSDSPVFLALGGFCGLTSFICHISANQQFKKVAELIEVELAANKIGLNIKF